MIIFAIMNVFNPQYCLYCDDYSMNVFNIATALMVQRRRLGAIIPMNIFSIMNVSNPQCCLYCDDYSMNVFNIATAFMVQRRRCCSFDSPGLARNEPTPGKHPQGDSTP